MKKIITTFIMMLCAACVASAANYLTFTAEEDSSTFGIMNEKNNPDVQYSLDGGETWTALAAGDTITLAHKGDKALLRGDNLEGFSKGYDKYSSFTMTGKIAASGSVMSLIDGTGLSTEITGEYCFVNLFWRCTSLTQAPELPATKLSDGCYAGMFQGCTSLTQAPELPATTLADHCYQYMFEGCTSLTQAPALPATTLSEWCYGYMFKGCTSLTQAPELPATTLVSACYQYMFSGCTSLTQAPKLPAPELLANSNAKNSCYLGMFSGCTNLSEISVAFVKWRDSTDRWEDNTYRWVENVAPTGTFYCPKALPLEYGVDRIPEGWTVKYIDDTVAVETNYLTFTAEEDGSSFGIVNKDNNPDVQYSLDGGETWTALAAGDTITLAHKGDKALLRGNNPEGFSKDWNQFSTLKMTGKVAASGSVMSLIDGVGLSTEVPGNYCFYKLFQGCTSLTQAPELPATTLAYSCYRDMFEGCTSLTQAPKLPATTLAEACYFGMFADCTNLTQAPELPATTLPTTSNVENGCYSLMFLGCTSLTQAPELPATTLAEGCYADMFYGCTSLTQAPKLPATTLSDFCYFEMFSGCTSLTQAPELPATTLTDFCYDRMFFGCTSLSEINVSFATWSDYYRSTAEWVENVAPTGTFICPKALALEYGISRIPEGWTVKYIEGEGSGVNTTLANNITVWSDDLTIYVRGAKGEVSIYDLSGKRVAVSYSADEERALSVPAKGVYVVRTNNGTSVVLVR
ncbi:MAG: leucine-rich repeat protein [Paludibacteraceae bacterium]|nr:leucine-rich repeat protein [Paludibacteraceae bacterium]